MNVHTQRLTKCRPYIKRILATHAHGPWNIANLCTAYAWPGNLPSHGRIAIIELGGGYRDSDMQQFFAGLNQPMPLITEISVDGTHNTHQNPRDDADYEVALDIQIAAASYFIATGRRAVIRIYWAQDIAPAVLAAAKDGCDTCSISWGADEASWGIDAAQEMEAVAKAATDAGMIVFAASGDNDSSDGGPTSANVDVPSSCPHVIGCGGTTKTLSNEVVWNNNPGQTNGDGTGGGYSMIFPVQPFQIGAPPAPKRTPGDKNPGTGRMVPDLAANADPNTGYEIVVYHQSVVVGGTSAVAPLMAGLFAACGVKLGFVTPKLWSAGPFKDIVTGNNGDYSAAPGPDPCSGIGTPIGNKIAALFQKA